MQPVIIFLDKKKKKEKNRRENKAITASWLSPVWNVTNYE